MNSMMENDVLANMPSNELQRIYPYLKLLFLEENRLLFDKGDELRHIYLPLSAVISMRYVLHDDLDIELTSVGRRFMAGAGVLNHSVSLYSAIVSVSGDCYQLPVDVFLQEFARMQGNRPLEPKAREVEFFPMKEVLHEEVKIH